MTSRFVSGGTIAGDGGAAEKDGALRGLDGEGGVGAGAGAGAGGSGGAETERDTTAAKATVEWEAVQKDLDDERRRRAEARKVAVEGGAGAERSLYEVLQANKAAKQAAFEEQNRIRNQFRPLDDDEIEFLHGVSDDKRAEEERVRRETEEGLAVFRKAQQAAGGGGDGVVDDGPADGAVDEEWVAAAGRKRKREKEKTGLKGVKRKPSGADDRDDGEKLGGTGPGTETGEAKGTDNAVSAPTHAGDVRVGHTPAKATTSSELAPDLPQAVKEIPKPKPALGLVDYGSDEDDE